MNKFEKIIFAFSSFFILLVSADSSNLRFGLISKNPQEPLSLLGLKTKAIVKGSYAEIQYIHTYSNPFDHALETEFYFPRTENSVFHKFEAVFLNQTIVGEIFRKSKAKREYQWNIKQGNTFAPDVIKVQIANIPAKEKVEIRFSVIQPLEVIINKFWSFTLPSVLTERYASPSVHLRETPDIRSVDLQHSDDKGWKVEVEIKSDYPFSYIHNPSHHLKPELSSASSLYKAIWDVTVIPNKNFVVYFRSDSLEQPSTILATHPSYPGDHVLLFNFVPQLNKIDTNKAEKLLSDEGEEGLFKLKNLVLKEDTETAKGEFIFAIDRSFSMKGQRFENLKKALERFLTNLPKDSLFNILSFGSSRFLYKPQSLQASPQNIREVLTWIQEIDADMEGTEILKALKRIINIPLTQGYLRTIMLLTDGDVVNPSEVINYVKENSEKARVCSVGIGSEVSEYLVKNIAKAGRCTSEIVLDDEDIGEKAVYMIQAATSQYLNNITFDIECFNSKHESVYKEQSRQGLLLKDEPFKKWIYSVDVSDIQYCDAKIGYENSLKRDTATEKLRIEDFQTAELTSAWHKVAYHSKLQDLDLEFKALKDYQKPHQKMIMINLSLRYQILSPYTSFLATLEGGTVNSGKERVEKIIRNLDPADHSSIHYAYHRDCESAKYCGPASFCLGQTMSASQPSQLEHLVTTEDFNENFNEAFGFVGLMIVGLFLGYLNYLFLRDSQTRKQLLW